MKNNSIIIDCPLCKEHTLHIVGEDEKVYQCISCGYMSSSNFSGNKEDNESFKTLDDNMKKWSKQSDERFWLPVILTLPSGMIFPFEEDDSMKWAFAELVQIDEKDRKNYPVPEKDGEYYKTMYDINNKKVFDYFYLAFAELTGRNA
tara:strand:- start:101 stop:541 length:441 start_codon:yes stop_codon:yes gene_type:complete